tara:strand:+ start:5718 stop:6521 length:804 start_codon:yes stop_codon:yes gene_type:complete
MKLKIVDGKNENKGEKDLPSQFSEPIRPDLIKKAVHVIQANNRQAYGSAPDAGQRHSSYVSKRRNSYRTTYGIGQSRTPRKVMSSRGTRFNWVGAQVPQTVGGRRAHPPKASKVWDQKLNRKERRKAIRSALSASMEKELVGKKHQVPETYPYIIASSFEDISKTKDVQDALKKLGLGKELSRCETKTVRSGKGTMRGRKYRRKVGPLVVVSKECKLSKAGANVPGVEILEVNSLNAEALAPGAVPGRLVLFTDKSLEVMEKEKLFL